MATLTRPAHYGPGRYAGGTGTELGLTSAGFQLLGEMERLNIILDLTHLADKAFWQALGSYGGPILASHNNCRALVPHQRQFDDTQIKAIIARDRGDRGGLRQLDDSPWLGARSQRQRARPIGPSGGPH